MKYLWVGVVSVAAGALFFYLNFSGRLGVMGKNVSCANFLLHGKAVDCVFRQIGEGKNGMGYQIVGKVTSYSAREGGYYFDVISKDTQSGSVGIRFEGSSKTSVLGKAGNDLSLPNVKISHSEDTGKYLVAGKEVAVVFNTSDANKRCGQNVNRVLVDRLNYPSFWNDLRLSINNLLGCRIQFAQLYVVE